MMREIALDLAARGFKVFPIAPGAKSPPLIPRWQIAATTSPVQIGTWWEHWPEANVGIHCDGLLVIDVDPKKGGFESLEVLEQEVQLDSTYEVETPSGGRHIYYRCATPVRNGVDLLGRGLDVRTTAGYVVAAGSRTVSGEYRVLVDEPIAECDGAIVGRCVPQSDRAGDRVREDNTPVATDEDAACARARAFLATHPVAIQGRGGDHHTFRTICRVRDFGVGLGLVAGVLSEWNARCVPPWEETELSVKIQNAYQYAQDPAGKLTPEALGFQPVAEVESKPAPVEKPVEAPLPPVEMLHPADVQPIDVLKVEYLVKGFLERETNAVLFGKWHVGKTFVVLDVAASIALGAKWFGRLVRKGRVLYLGYEGIRAMKKRMLALRGKYPALNDRSVPMRWAPLRHPLTTAEGAAELMPLFATFKQEYGEYPDLVIVDPLMNALGGDDADANLMGILNRRVSEMMDRYKCTVLRVHHVGHGNDERARGHSSLPAGADTEIRVDENEIVLTKQRDDTRGVPLKFTLKVVPIGEDTDGDKVTTCVVEQVDANPMDPKLTRQEKEVMDAIVKLRGDGGVISKGDIKYCSPGLVAQRREEIIRELVNKNYLWPEGDDWRVAERGPVAMFE